jgi:hypothetical protein
VTSNSFPVTKLKVQMFEEKNSTLVEDVKERTATREGKKEEDTDKKNFIYR